MRATLVSVILALSGCAVTIGPLPVSDSGPMGDAAPQGDAAPTPARDTGADAGPALQGDASPIPDASSAPDAGDVPADSGVTCDDVWRAYAAAAARLGCTPYFGGCPIVRSYDYCLAHLQAATMADDGGTGGAACTALASLESECSRAQL